MYIAIKCRKEDYACIGKFRPDGVHHIKAAEIWQMKVHQGTVGPQCAKGFNPFLAVRSAPIQRHVEFAVDDGADALSYQRVGVNAYNPDATGVQHIWLSPS